MASASSLVCDHPYSNGPIKPCFKLVSMQGGCGDDSYSQNSRPQNYLFHALVKPHLSEAISHCITNVSDRPFRIADFGCSSGGNTIEYAEFIVDQLQSSYNINVAAAKLFCPEIQYFFSDLPCNDFNHLFQTLLDSVNENEATRKGSTRFYVAGVPGSFYGRLFPKGSLDFAMSALSLRFLSRVPPAVMDQTSPAWNGGHIWLHADRPNVCEAYAQQFHADIRNFLNCRAQELAKGGIMFLFSFYRAQLEHPKDVYFGRYDLFGSYFESAWNETVEEACRMMNSLREWDSFSIKSDCILYWQHMGLISVAERDMFNVPLYNFSRPELELALKDVPELELLKMEVMTDEQILPEHELRHLLNDPRAFGKFFVGVMKSLMKPMVEKHLGEARATEFFKRLQRIATLKANLTKDLADDLLVAIIRRK